ncbi:hypothetical protein [Raoultella planticola]|nr:hypothetical protein [Raoultella planticola]
MKYVFALMLSVGLSGCSANDWVDAASGIMQAHDKQEKRRQKQAYKSR